MSEALDDFIRNIGFSYQYKNDEICKTLTLQKKPEEKQLLDAYKRGKYKEFFEEVKSELEDEDKLKFMFKEEALIIPAQKKMGKIFKKIAKDMPKNGRLLMVRLEIEKAIGEWLRNEMTEIKRG